MPGVSDNVNGSCFAARNIPMSHMHTDPRGHVFPESHTALELTDSRRHSSYATLATEIYS